MKQFIVHLREGEVSRKTLCGRNHDDGVYIPLVAMDISYLKRCPTDLSLGSRYRYCKVCSKNKRIPLVLLDNINL